MMDFTPDGIQMDHFVLVSLSGKRYKVTVSDEGNGKLEVVPISQPYEEDEIGDQPPPHGPAIGTGGFHAYVPLIRH